MPLETHTIQREGGLKYALFERLLDFLTFIFFWGGVERGLDSPMTPHFLGLPSHHHHTEQKGRRLPFFGPLFIAPPYIMRLSFGGGVLLVGKKKRREKKKEKKKKKKKKKNGPFFISPYYKEYSIGMRP